MTEEQQELYDIVSDWWDDVFVASSIIDWKDPPQQYPVEGFE
jgi:hypothetical protein